MTSRLQAQGHEDDLLAQDRTFFEALIQRDKESLDRILAEDFTLIDITGGQMTKEQFLGLLEEGQLKFLSIIAQGGTRVRVYRSAAAAVTGRTMIEVQYMGAEMSIESRYTHVYAEEAGAWWLEIAQWTAIEQT